jgi:hypothetical protein
MTECGDGACVRACEQMTNPEMGGNAVNPDQVRDSGIGGIVRAACLPGWVHLVVARCSLISCASCVIRVDR